MLNYSTMSPRIASIRERCRNTEPRIDINRYKLVTKFYQENPQLTGILKRAKNLRNLFENMPVLINEDELQDVLRHGITQQFCRLDDGTHQ